MQRAPWGPPPSDGGFWLATSSTVNPLPWSQGLPPVQLSPGRSGPLPLRVAGVLASESGAGSLERHHVHICCAWRDPRPGRPGSAAASSAVPRGMLQAKCPQQEPHFSGPFRWHVKGMHPGVRTSKLLIWPAALLREAWKISVLGSSLKHEPQPETQASLNLATNSCSALP